MDLKRDRFGALKQKNKKTVNKKFYVGVWRGFKRVRLRLQSGNLVSRISQDHRALYTLSNSDPEAALEKKEPGLARHRGCD